MNKGFVGLYITIIVLMVTLAVLVSMGFSVVVQQRIAQNTVQSAQAYYGAEAGVEDALIRLKSGKNVCNPPGSPPCSNSISLWSGPAIVITVSDVVGGARTVTAEGDATNRFRTVQTVFEISSTGVGFNYGAQIGEGGLQMDNNAIVNGNVFSNGNVIGENGSRITGTVQIAGPGKILDNVDIGTVGIGGDAYVDICQNSGSGTRIEGDLHTNSAGPCVVVGSTTSSGLPIAPIPLPILDSQIDAWKLDADDGFPLVNITVTDTLPGVDLSLGPKKITGELIVDNNATLEVTGTLWVVGKVTIKNGAVVQLNPGYGTSSGMIISNDIVLLDNNSVSKGSGQAGSYLMYISTSTSSQAIESKNNAKADILYTNTGTIKVDNNAGLREVVGYRMHLLNNAVITYESGLANSAFTSGPGGGWVVTSWKEIE